MVAREPMEARPFVPQHAPWHTCVLAGACVGGLQRGESCDMIWWGQTTEAEEKTYER
jgi:hypothetical protein